MSHSTLIHKCCLVLGICLALVVATHAQTQGMRDFGNRLEGTNVHLDALEDFTLIAVHRNFTPFSRNANLNVRFFLPKLIDMSSGINQISSAMNNGVVLHDLISFQVGCR